MAAQAYAHPAIAAGLAGGIGLMIPAAAYVATSSLGDAHALVQSGGMPFAVGALAGAGMCAVAVALLDRSAERAAERAEDVAFARDSKVHAAAAEEPEGARFFSGKHVPKGVPVIARAHDALSEAEAWAEIDSLLSGDSPISCDPERSKDIYQIALEELRRTSEQPVSAPGSARPAPASSTAAFMAVASQAAVQAVPVTAKPAGVPADTTATFMAMASRAAAVTSPIAGRQPLSDTDAARRAALSSLDAAVDVYDLDEPAFFEDVPDAPAPVADPASSQDVPMADYSGHEEMWAAALAILEEEVPTTVETVVASAPRVRHEAVAPESERAAAIAEGERETRMHGRVNEILGEEFEKVHSSSVRKTSREFLSVIQGGTMSMPRLQAEA